MTVRVQKQDFDLGAELAALSTGKPDIGAVVTFTGIVRGKDGGDLFALELEHYPGMTEQALSDIEAEACRRWDLKASLIIHRTGVLPVGAQIMMVATASPHRQDAFEAAEYLMDFLKSRAPFWKKEHGASGNAWVDARDSDEHALKRWDAS